MIDIKQVYETELFHRAGVGLRAITIPRRSISNEGLLAQPERIAQILEIKIVDAFDFGWVQRAILSVLVAESGEELYKWRENNTILHERLKERPEFYEFAEYVSMTPVIPFENSPLSAESLGALLTKVGGYGVGAYIGFLIVGGSTPLLLITVPAGMIICGAAAGISQGLEKGLKERIYKIINGK